MKEKKIFIFYFIVIFTNFLLCSQDSKLVSSPWSEIQKRIYIQRGVLTSVWEDRYTTYYHMVPAGDGTFIAKTELLTGNIYNFIFFASTNGITYYDAVPSSGKDTAFIIIQGSATERTSFTWYDKIGNDARRILFVPPDLVQGTTIWVYSNWSSTPTPPTNFRARPGNGKVTLTWEAPYGHWGTSGESFKAADVIYGGYYEIFRSTSPEGDYVKIATVPGDKFVYVDTTVVNGTRYYYTIVSHDAYKDFLALRSEQSKVMSVMPNEPINIRFRVEGIDIKKVIKEFNSLVYLTPENTEDKYSIKYKTPARFTYCYLRKRFLGIF